MKRFLYALVVFEGAVLVAAALVFFLAGEALARRPPPPSVFVPQILGALGGEKARYAISDLQSGEPLGFVTFAVHRAEQIQGVVGRRIHAAMEVLDTAGRVKAHDLLLIDPRTGGWVPPLLRADSLPPGDWPVPRKIESARVEVKGAEGPGFRVEFVRPRWGLDEVAETHWYSARAPVFGLVRLESHRGIPDWFGGRPLLWKLSGFEFPSRRR